MMRNMVAVALVAAAAAVQAQGITLYGIFDAGVEYLNNANAAKQSLVRVPSLSGTVPSRWGMRGSEDLGGGLRSVFVLESGFFPDSGASAQGARLFGRQAFVGLSSSWGTVALGRQYTMMFWSLLDADVIGPHIYSMGSLDGYIPNTRSDNAIGYRGTFGAVTIGGTYSFGRDASNAGGPAATNCPGESATDRQACRQWSALLKFDDRAWGAAIAIDRMLGGAGAAFGLNRSSLADERISANGYVKFGETKIGGGLIRRNNEGSPTTPRSDLWYLGLTVPFATTYVLDAQALKLDFKNSANDARLLILRASNNLSKRTAIYLTTGLVSNDGSAAFSASAGGTIGTGMTQTGVMAGMRHLF